MKKYLLLIGTLVSVQFLLASCIPSPSAGDSSIVGTWRLVEEVSRSYENGILKKTETYTPESGDNLFMEFGADGSCLYIETEMGESETLPGDYKLLGDVLIVSILENNTKESITYTIESITSSTLILVIDYTNAFNDTEYRTYKRLTMQRVK